MKQKSKQIDKDLVGKFFEATKMIHQMIHGIKKFGRNKNDTIQEKKISKGIIMSAHFSGT